MQRTPVLATAAVAALMLVVTATTTTSAAGTSPSAPRSAPLVQGLLSPLSVAVASGGTAYVSQNFAGLLMKKRPGYKAKTIYAAKGGKEVGALSVRKGVVTFGVTGTRKFVKRITKSGRVSTLANVGAYERNNNPDAGVTYGFRDITDECATQVPAGFGPAKYTGIVDSHPYATVMTAGGTYLADAAANAILKIDNAGTVTTVALLPVAQAVVSAEAAAAAGLPDCVVGLTYSFEPVPTDVERGPDGMLYVSSLPGGPEDGSAGPLASVYRVDPSTGTVTQVASGMVSAVGLAVANNGDIFVSELFAGRISRIPHGTSTPEPYKSVPLPGAVEWTPDALYATTNVLSGLSGEPGDVPAGKLVRFAF